MLIGTGLGLLTPIILLVAFAAVAMVVVAPGGSGDMTVNPFAPAVSLLLAGVANYWLGRRLNMGAERTVVDEQTGERLILRRTHTFFFIRMEHWGLVLLAGAGVLAVVAVVRTVVS